MSHNSGPSSRLLRPSSWKPNLSHWPNLCSQLLNCSFFLSLFNFFPWTRKIDENTTSSSRTLSFVPKFSKPFFAVLFVPMCIIRKKKRPGSSSNFLILNQGNWWVQLSYICFSYLLCWLFCLAFYRTQLPFKFHHAVFHSSVFLSAIRVWKWLLSSSKQYIFYVSYCCSDLLRLFLCLTVFFMEICFHCQFLL